MYKFDFEGKTYELNEEKFQYLIGDDEIEVQGIDLHKILNLLSESKEVGFTRQYYKDPCDICIKEDSAKEKYYGFLECHFYIFTKNNEYVVSSISEEYEPNSYGRLVRLGKLDNSFLVSVIVCANCGAYEIEIEQVDM